MKNTRSSRFPNYTEVINYINKSKGITNVRLYVDGQSVVMTWEFEDKK